MTGAYTLCAISGSRYTLQHRRGNDFSIVGAKIGEKITIKAIKFQV